MDILGTTLQNALPTLGGYRTKQELAYESLRDAIITCHFPPGTRLLEGELAQQLHMSRSPVREALKRLAHEGLVKETPHVGVTVADVVLESLHELYLILATLEGLACHQATLRHSTETIQAMAQTLEMMKSALAQADYTEWGRLNVEFHRLSRQECALPQLLRMIEDTWMHIRRFQIYQGAVAVRATQSAIEHDAIYEAMRDGDAERAEAAVKAHYLAGDRQFAEYLRSLSEASTAKQGEEPA